MAELRVSAAASPEAELQESPRHENETPGNQLKKKDAGFTNDTALKWAKLYNEILAYSYSKLVELAGYAPYEEVKRNDFLREASRYSNLDQLINLEDSPLYHFLSNIEYLPSTRPRDETGGLLTPFTTELLPQHISLLDKEHYMHSHEYCGMISLFYGVEVAETDRLVFDYRTGLAFWEEDYPSHISPHRQLRWGPLEFFLTTWLNDWKSGRYYWESTIENPPFNLKLNHWTADDLQAALVAWTELLDVIECRMSNNTATRLPPLLRKSLRNTTFDSFSYAFLTQAIRPTFKYVAPGISAWSDIVTKNQYYDPAQYGVKDEESFTTLRDLLVPNLKQANASVKEEDTISPIEQPPTPIEIVSGYILYGKAALYSCPKMILGSYWLTVFHGSSDTDKPDFVFLNRDPSLNIRGGATSLHRIFAKWKDLVESGAWGVDEYGVSTGPEWFYKEENVNMTVID